MEGNHSCTSDVLYSDFFTKIIVTPTLPSAYIILATVQIVFVVIPAVILNTATIVLLYKTDRKDNHPSVVIFYWMSVVCLLGACSYGLLMSSATRFYTGYWGY